MFAPNHRIAFCFLRGEEGAHTQLAVCSLVRSIHLSGLSGYRCEFAVWAFIFISHDVSIRDVIQDGECHNTTRMKPKTTCTYQHKTPALSKSLFKSFL